MPKKLAPPPRRPGLASVARLLTQQQADHLHYFGHACDVAYTSSLRAAYIKAGIIKPAKETAHCSPQ